MQDAIFQANQNSTDLALILQTHPIGKHLTTKVLEDCLDLTNLMPKVNQIYQRVFANYEKN